MQGHSTESQREDAQGNFSLGSYIRLHRKKCGISINELARRVRMHESYVSRVESGIFQRPSPEKLQLIAGAIKASYDDLCALAGYKTPDGLPSFAPYLRAKYVISDKDVRQLHGHFEALQEKHGIVERVREPLPEPANPWPSEHPWETDSTWPNPDELKF